MRTFTVFTGLILFWMQGLEAQEIYSVPFSPLKDPWMMPSEGVLINENAPVYVARKVNGQVNFSNYPNMIKLAMDHAMQTQEYQRANVDSFMRTVRQHRIERSRNPNAPAILYPELLVVVAYDLYQKLGNNIWAVIPYIVAFYNGVDMAYRELQSPKIRLNIAAIVVEEENGVFDYLRNSLKDPEKVRGNSIALAGNFWYQQKDTFPLDSYDAVISMTTRGLCNVGYEENSEVCTGNILGLATLSGMCAYSTDYETASKVAVVSDSGHFTGVHTAAHEIGHLLGAHHDGTLAQSETAGYSDIPRCRVKPGSNGYFIMYPTSTSGAKDRVWSDCSLDYFQRYFREANHTCLHNKPAAGRYSFPRLIPGKIIGSIDNLCRAKGYGKACSDPKNFCQNLQCEKSETSNMCLIMPNPVFDGIPCDVNDPTKFCMFGECMSSNDFK